MKKKIGVVLAGCGVYDGSEIHEAVITLLAIDRAGAEAVCMAPDVNQMHVINHLTGEESPGETRNVLVESARIARGAIQDIANVEADELDASSFPGRSARGRRRARPGGRAARRAARLLRRREHRRAEGGGRWIAGWSRKPWRCRPKRWA